eukprot:gene43529-58949_t
MSHICTAYGSPLRARRRRARRGRLVETFGDHGMTDPTRTIDCTHVIGPTGPLMRVRDFLLLATVCIVWGFSNVLSKIIVGQWGVPPLFYAALRFAIVLLVTLPWLRPAPKPLWRIVLIGLLMGGGNFALLFIGLQTASPSSAGIVVQASVPITTLLSIVMLGERIHWRRWLGIALTLAGVVLVIWHPHGVALSV